MCSFHCGGEVKIKSINVGKDFEPEPGDVFYSKFFGSEGVVISYKSPKKWTFQLKNDNRILKAKSKPSELTWVKVKRLEEFK